MGLLSLKQLTVTNFRAVKGTVTLDFDQPPGLYFVAGKNLVQPRLGANDAGKSTLFSEALSWLLQARTSRASRPGADVVNWYANGSPAGVTGVFSLDGELHTIERYRNPSRLTLDRRVVDQSDIDKLLPLSDSALRRTLLIDQFGSMFLALRPEDKSRIFSETLNLDQWIKASDRAGEAQKASDAVVTKCQTNLTVVTTTLADVRAQLTQVSYDEATFETELNNHIEKLIKDIRAANVTARKSREALNKARSDLAQFDDNDEELDEYRKTEKELSYRVTTDGHQVVINQTKLRQAEDELTRYGKSTRVCPECGQVVTQEHMTAKVTEIRKRIKSLKSNSATLKENHDKGIAELEALRAAISNFEESRHGYDQAQSRVQLAAGQSLFDDHEVNRLKIELQAKRDQDNPFTAQADRLTERLNKLVAERRELRIELKLHQGNTAIFKFWRDGFREIRLEQIDTTLAELELAANRHAESLGLDDWEIHFATERETTSGNISHKFSVFLYPPGQNDPVAWENYAGGVSQRWQLATTAALSEILLARAGIDTDFEIIDEPTIHLSQEGIEDLIECLKERALLLNRRIFLIDHHSLGVGSFDGVLTVVRDNSGVRVE